MNEIMNVMKERRSIRKFKPDMPSKEDLNQIIEAGLYAASGMGKQAATFCLFKHSPKKRFDGQNGGNLN